MALKGTSARLHSAAWLLGAWLVLLGASAAAAGAQIPPEQVMSDLSHTMIETLKRDRAEVNAHPQRLFQLVDQVLAPHVDFPRMSGWVLGRYWRQATPEQRKRFIAAFRTMLVRFYTAALLDNPSQLDQLLAHSDNLITFLPTRPVTGDTAVVRSEVHLQGGKTVKVAFAVNDRDGAWKVYDVNVEGISLVMNYRASFAEQIQREGLDGLIAQLEQRNRTLMEQVGKGAKSHSAE